MVVDRSAIQRSDRGAISDNATVNSRTVLNEPGYRDFISQQGLIIVEGFNDLIGLDNLGVPALGILSNRMTATRGEKIARWAKQLASGRVNLMFDCEGSGVEGAKEAL